MKRYLILLICVTVTSCNYMRKVSDTEILAKFDGTVLKASDFPSVDTTKVSQELIDKQRTERVHKWAIRQLLLKKAHENLQENDISVLEELVDEYRDHLYTNLYLEKIIGKFSDTVISDVELESYYKLHKENFHLNQALYKLRYIQMNQKDYLKNRPTITALLTEENIPEDFQAYYFSHYFLNDSVWVKHSRITEKFQLPGIEEVKKSIQRRKVINISVDSTIFSVCFFNYLPAKGQTPLDYLKPTLTKVILNQKYKEFADKLGEDLLKEAIKKNQIEIYE